MICGVAESDDAILDLFDKIIYLEIDDTVLVQRLSKRSKDDYGQNKFEQRDILLRKNRLDEKYAVIPGIVEINANKPLHEVVQHIIANI